MWMRTVVGALYDDEASSKSTPPVLPCVAVRSNEGRAMVADMYLDVAHGVVIITRYAAVTLAVVAVVVAVVVVVVEEGSLNPLTGLKSAQMKGLGQAPALISSTVSSRGQGQGQMVIVEGMSKR